MKTIETILAIVEHPFWMVQIGLVMWFLLKWSIAKNKQDKKNGGFDGKRWFRLQYDDILVSLMFGFMLVSFDDELLQAYNDHYSTDHPIEFKRYYYLLAGPFSNLLYIGVNKLIH